MGSYHGLVLVEHLDAPFGKRPRPPLLSPEPDLAEQVEVDVGDGRGVDPPAVPGPGARERETDTLRSHPGLPAPQQEDEARHLGDDSIMRLPLHRMGSNFTSTLNFVAVLPISTTGRPMWS